MGQQLKVEEEVDSGAVRHAAGDLENGRRASVDGRVARRGGDHAAARRDSRGLVVAAVLVVVVAVVAGYLVVSGDRGGAQVGSNADEAAALQDEKVALVANSSGSGDAWAAYADRLSGQAAYERARSGEQDAGEVLSGDAADKANALRQADAARVGVDNGAEAADKANALRRADAASAGHDGGAAAAAANALVQEGALDAEDAHEQEASDRLVSQGLVPDARVDRDDQVLDRLVAGGLVPDGGERDDE